MPSDLCGLFTYTLNVIYCFSGVKLGNLEFGLAGPMSDLTMTSEGHKV